MQEILQKAISRIEEQGFNKFIMTNNITDEKILGYRLKMTTRPNYNYFNCAIEEYTEKQLCIELDRTQDLVFQEFANKLAFQKNMHLKKKITWFKTLPVSYISSSNILVFNFGDVKLKIECQKDDNRKYDYHRFSDNLWGFGFFDIKYLDYENSLIDNSKIYAVIDTYKLGKLSDTQISKLKLEYIDLLNCAKEIKNLNDEYNAKKYNRSSSPFCMYDEENKQCYIGLWDNSNKKPLSLYPTEKYKYRIEYIDNKIKELCDEVYTYNICDTFDLDVFGVKIKNCVLLK